MLSLFLFLLVLEGLRVDVVGLSFVLPALLGHFLLNAVQNQLRLLLSHMAEIIVADLHLERIIEAELLPCEGVVELVAVVDPALRNHRVFLVEKLVQLLLLPEVVFRGLGFDCWRSGRLGRRGQDE